MLDVVAGAPTRMTASLHSGVENASIVGAVEATRLAREVRGIGRYVRAILPRLVAQRPELRIVLFVKKQGHVSTVTQMFAENPVLRDRIEVRPVREMPRFDADVFWYPWNVASPLPSRGAVVVTMHDVAPLAFPDPRFLKWRKNFRWRRRYASAALNADIIIADSAFTADEVNRYLSVPHERMRVVLLAADDLSVPAADNDSAALARLGVQRPFVLAVGAADRRKNLGLVERAMQRVVEEHPAATLVLAGPREDKIEPGIEAPWRKTLGFVSEDELVTLYRTAEALVMSSTYEGFGLPVLEAMSFGTPVICARASSLPEVGGDAAEWVEPDDDAQAARAISRLLSDPGVKASMRAASLVQAARFSWDQTARQTLAAFDDAIAITRRSRQG